MSTNDPNLAYCLTCQEELIHTDTSPNDNCPLCGAEDFGPVYYTCPDGKEYSEDQWGERVNIGRRRVCSTYC